MKTKNLVKWLQKHDPSGNLEVDATMDGIEIIKPKKGEPGTYHIVAEIDDFAEKR